MLGLLFSFQIQILLFNTSKLFVSYLLREFFEHLFNMSRVEWSIEFLVVSRNLTKTRQNQHNQANISGMMQKKKKKKTKNKTETAKFIWILLGRWRTLNQETQKISVKKNTDFLFFKFEHYLFAACCFVNLCASVECWANLKWVLLRDLQIIKFWKAKLSAKHLLKTQRMTEREFQELL